MTHADDPTSERLTELEIKASFAEDLLDQLNQAIFRQQQQIDRLIREVLLLRQEKNQGEAGTPRNPLDERPPHY
ncbi:MAG: SlyX family protein [Hylemonella sp.]|nr:SlyX family protein [Hylemonella sp.]